MWWLFRMRTKRAHRLTAMAGRLEATKTTLLGYYRTSTPLKDFLIKLIYAAWKMTWRIEQINFRECMNDLCQPLLECWIRKGARKPPWTEWPGCGQNRGAKLRRRREGETLTEIVCKLKNTSLKDTHIKCKNRSVWVFQSSFNSAKIVSLVSLLCVLLRLRSQCAELACDEQSQSVQRGHTVHTTHQSRPHTRVTQSESDTRQNNR